MNRGQLTPEKAWLQKQIERFVQEATIAGGYTRDTFAQISDMALYRSSIAFAAVLQGKTSQEIINDFAMGTTILSALLELNLRGNPLYGDPAVLDQFSVALHTALKDCESRAIDPNEQEKNPHGPRH